jgi:hypothetical protein
MLSDLVSVILDGGPTADDQPSTIVDCTGDRPRVLRVGAISEAELRTVLASADVELDGLASQSAGSQSAEPESAEPESAEPKSVAPSEPSPPDPESSPGA